MTDEQLVQLCKEGNMEAYGVLFSRHRGQVEQMARRVVRDEARAEDLTQAVFVRLFDRIQQVSDINNFSAWLNRVTRNYAIDELRRDKCIQMVAIDNCVPETFSPQESWSRPADNDPYTETARKEIRDIVQDVIRDLPANYRTALSMRFLQGNNIPEIAAAMSLETTQVNTLLHRAKKAFRKEMIRQITARPNIPAECRKFGPKLALLIEGDLGAETARVQGHVDGCRYCQQTERDLRATAYERGLMPMGAGAGWLTSLRQRAAASRTSAGQRASAWASSFTNPVMGGSFAQIADRAAIAMTGLLVVGVAAAASQLAVSAGSIKGAHATAPLAVAAQPAAARTTAAILTLGPAQLGEPYASFGLGPAGANAQVQTPGGRVHQAPPSPNGVRVPAQVSHTGQVTLANQSLTTRTPGYQVTVAYSGGHTNVLSGDTDPGHLSIGLRSH